VAAQPPTSGEAQGRPGVATDTSPTAVAATTSSCADLPAYQTAFDEAYTTAAIANPDARPFLLEAQSNPEVQNIFEDITPEEASALSGFYLSLADAIEAITPPTFAADWHAVQIEIFRELGECSANIAA